jgi:hypothetical protein
MSVIVCDFSLKMFKHGFFCISQKDKPSAFSLIWQEVSMQVKRLKGDQIIRYAVKEVSPYVCFKRDDIGIILFCWNELSMIYPTCSKVAAYSFKKEIHQAVRCFRAIYKDQIHSKASVIFKDLFAIKISFDLIRSHIYQFISDRWVKHLFVNYERVVYWHYCLLFKLLCSIYANITADGLSREKAIAVLNGLSACVLKAELCG